MTISSTSNQTMLLGNGSTTVFNFSFIGDAAPFFFVIYTDAVGTQTLLNSAQYSLFLNPATVGSLWGIGGTLTYPLTGPPIADGTSLTLTRTLPLLQTVSLSNQGDMWPTVTERALDTLCMQIQQVSGRTGQIRGVWTGGIAYNYGDVVQDGINGTNTQNYYMCAIANTSNMWSSDLAAGDWVLVIDVQTIAGYATTASAGAATATAQAAIATTEAGISTAGASTATTQAAIATSAAATSTTNAASAAADVVLTHADVVLTHADVVTANTAATTATSGATTATTQAGIATTQAGIATTEAGIATAQAIIAASTLTATSTTSNTIGTGTFSFTTQTNKQFQSGQFIVISSGANYIAGNVTSYNPTAGALVISASSSSGSGTFTSWNISVSGIPGTSGTGSGTVTSVSVSTANGVSASVASPTSTPALTFTLGAIAPTSVNASGTVQGSNLSGTNTGDQTTISGNAGTATKLATARAINGVNFDGTAAITVTAAANTLSGSTLAVGVTASSLTSVGTLANLTVTNPIAGAVTGNAATVTTNANLTGDVTSSGNATTIGAKKVLASMLGSGAATSGQVATADGSGGVSYTTSSAAGGLLNTIYYTQPTVTCSISIHSPAVISFAASSLQGGQNNCPVIFSTTGALPTGLVAGTVYYIVNAANGFGGAFNVAATPGGSAITTTGTQSGTQTISCAPYLKATNNPSFITYEIQDAGSSAFASSSSPAGNYGAGKILNASLGSSVTISVGKGALNNVGSTSSIGSVTALTSDITLMGGAQASTTGGNSPFGGGGGPNAAGSPNTGGGAGASGNYGASGIIIIREYS